MSAHPGKTEPPPGHVLFYTVFELSGSQVLLRALREFLEGNTQAFVKGTAFVLVDCSALK